MSVSRTFETEAGFAPSAAKHGRTACLMGWDSFRAALEYSAAWGLWRFLQLLPRGLSGLLGRMLACLVYLFVPRIRHVGDLNLRLAFPRMTRAERTRVLRRSMLNLGRHMADFVGVSSSTLHRIVECEGFDHIDRALAAGRGAILITAHLGGWELINFALAEKGYRGEFLVRRGKNHALNQLMDRIRTRFGTCTLDRRSAARLMLKRLRSGSPIGLLVDINVVRDQGMFVDFFGVRASTTFMTAKLSLRTGAPVVPIFAPWDERRRRYMIRVVEPLTVEPSGVEENDIRLMTEKFTQIIEDEIRSYPDQWLWIHKRWRTQPKGEPNLYAELES
jgi:KDO2-lipid IV(A) lauroyltransferase